ncbi:restriction endonuclease subunit S [Enterococcus faecalis]|uniref:restriction endonuclease subunit S n=1 Tax=Enterococcus faecalis TaxID=1351 RepID=UPI00046C8047|nr:restriction endonuclease subunit S [Enterococcus faecalis]EJG4541327.1 restriction endonuclease subunit S [Enterococcus faecalis]MBA0028983.1 restriction endonuclease subunit S [Enterococcus faecalis]MBA0109288.1 restriction endonuclease subunit S [Enterococcus faecalis]MDB7733314.1 restriction endonuclease subunit S [Enterococcus faecalis]MDG0921700.1 restriction endonuclease subunit S [Enterococcus faecalis]
MIVFTLIGVWEQCKLGDLGSVAMNKRIFKEQTSESGDIPFYKIGTFGATADAFISRELFETYKKKYPYPKIGDLLISASGSIGRVVEYKGNDEYFQDSNIVWLKHDDRINNLFLKQFYSIVKWHGLEGSTIKRLYNKNILETTIHLPVFDEQEKIGTLFKQLDDIITLHQRKLEQLKELKKAYLQLMFPTKEERVPKLRFADFEGEWELCKLIGILDIIKGTQKSKSELSTNQNNCTPYPVYNGGINPSGYTNIYNRENAITISEGGNSAGFVNFVQEKFFSGGHNYTIVNNVTDTLFLFFYLCSIQEEIMRLRVGTGLPNIQKPTLMNLEIQKTTDNEQKFIGLFLKNIDILITLTQNKLNQLKSLKKSYLQNMFI